MTILVSGSTGIIGANYVLDWIAGSEESVFNLDTLTDAHKLELEPSWKPAETFETCIRKTVYWYLVNLDCVANVQSDACREWVSKQYFA